MWKIAADKKNIMIQTTEPKIKSNFICIQYKSFFKPQISRTITKHRSKELYYNNWNAIILGKEWKINEFRYKKEKGRL